MKGAGWMDGRSRIGWPDCRRLWMISVGRVPSLLPVSWPPSGYPAGPRNAEKRDGFVISDLILGAGSAANAKRRFWLVGRGPTLPDGFCGEESVRSASRVESSLAYPTDLCSPFKFHPPLHRQYTCTSQSRLLSTASLWVMEPRPFR